MKLATQPQYSLFVVKSSSLINQRKTIVNSWVRCLENNYQLSPLVFRKWFLETQYFSCCLLHFINSYLGIYLKTKKKPKEPSKTNKQTKQNKKEKKKEKGKRRSIAEFEPGTFGLTRPHIATTPLRMIKTGTSQI